MGERAFRTVALSLVVLCALGTAAHAARSRAVSAGFEDFTDGGPTGWGTWSRREGALSVAADTGQVRSGQRALRVVHTGPRDWAVTYGRRVSVKPGDIFEITGWARCEEVVGRVAVSVVVRGDGPTPIDWLYGAAATRGSHDWSRLHSRFVVPEGAVSVELRLTGVGQGKAWFDDVTLVKAGSLEEMRRRMGGHAEPVEVGNAAVRVRIEPEKGRFYLTDRRASHTYASRGLSDTVILSARRQGERKASLTLLHASGGQELRAALAVDEREPVFTVSLTTDADEMEEALAFPPPFESEEGDWLVVPMNEGILYPVDDRSVDPPNRLVGYSGHGLSMPWFGVTDMERGMMAVIGTPDDMYVEFRRGENGCLYAAPLWQPSRGSLRYERSITYRVFDRGGYVEQARAYRKVAKQEGRFRSLKEKRQANPDVDLLVGAPDVWTVQVDPVAVARELHEGGVERLLFCFHGSRARRADRAEQVEKIQDLGYLVTRYDTYRTSWPEGEPEYARRHHTTPENIVKRKDGSLRRAWTIKRGGKSYPGYELTSSEQLREAGEYVPSDQKKHNWDGRFIDTTTAASLMEDYDPDHPLTRTQDRHNKTDLLGLISKDLGLICGSETGQDWAAPVVHYFEGMMSLAHYRVPDAGRNIYDYHPPTEKQRTYLIGPKYRVPLWELVYHDSVVAYWYWGDASNKQPELWDARDLWNVLYCTPPLWMIDREAWREHKDRFLKCYRDVCPVVRKAGHREMTDHEFLTQDHAVQRTTFSGGLRVTVNFGEEPYRTASGRTVRPMDYLVEERQGRQSGF